MAKLKPNQFILNGHIITEIPLLFQGPLVQANLEDRKTQTRRTKGLDKLTNHYFQSLVHHATGRYTFVENGNYSPKNEDVVEVKSPYGKPGDLLWVRETFLVLEPEHCKGLEDRFLYKANFDPESDELRREYMEIGYPYQWKPSIHMPKAASRLWLMVEEIRVERVQDISEADAIAEGVEKSGVVDPEFDVPVVGWKDYDEEGNWFTTGDGFWGSPPQRSFRSLWFSINGLESWKQNPWVWAIKYRILSKTGRPSDEVIEKNWKEVCGG